MENFGEFITKEFGLSKKILGYLPLIDLLNVRSVCRDWKNVVDLIISHEFSKEPKVYFSDSDRDKSDQFCYWSNLKFLPEVVIKCMRVGVKSRKDRRIAARADLSELWKPIYCTEDYQSDEELQDPNGKLWDVSPKIIHLECDGYFSATEENGKTTMLHSSFFADGGAATLGLPAAPGVHYSLFISSLKYFKTKGKPEYHVEELYQNKDQGPIRCVLVFDNCKSHSDYAAINRFIRYVVQTIKDLQESPFAVGGGKVDTLNWWRSYRNDPQAKHFTSSTSICGVIVRGENVIAHSDIMVEEITTGDINNFMEQLAQRVGPIPSGASRVAIMAQCVDRPEKLRRIYRFPDTEIEILELSYFTKHFPGTPVFGFVAGGEYGTQANTHPPPVPDNYEPEPKIRKQFINFYDKHQEYMHWQSTSIVILTFLNTRK